ncbi:MAG: glycosyltransferase family 2 protein [Dehalococcoidia bacterium]
MTLVVIIVNYKTPGMVIDCLASLEPQVAALPNCRVVIADNASPDNSVPMIGDAIAQRRWSSWALLRPLPRNGGFAAGNNAALQEFLGAPAPPDAFLLLNPDTLVRDGALPAFLDFMRSKPRAGIAGARLEDAQAVPDAAAHAFPTPWREFQRALRLGRIDRLFGPLSSPRNTVSDPPHRCDWVSGAALCVRREVLEQVGLLDEGYFLYFDEVDLCRRAANAGWECWTLPNACIVHLEGAATGIRDVTSRRARYWFESRRRYFLKHHGRAGLLLADACWALGRFPRWLHGVVTGRNHLPVKFSRDLLLGDARALLRGGRIAP